MKRLTEPQMTAIEGLAAAEFARATADYYAVKARLDYWSLVLDSARVGVYVAEDASVSLPLLAPAARAPR